MRDELHEALPTSEPVNFVDVCRHILRIVARLESKPYTESTLCQTVELELDDPANPASDLDTTQGWDVL